MKFSLAITILAAVVAPSEQEESCIADFDLIGYKRPPGLTASEKCARDYTDQGFLDPYECKDWQFSCCTPGATPEGVDCTLISDDVPGTNYDILSELTGTECTGTMALMWIARNGLTPEEVCVRDYGLQPRPYPQPYECTGKPAYACCADGLNGTLTPSEELGTCTPWSGASMLLTAKGLASVVGMAAVVAAGLV